MCQEPYHTPLCTHISLFLHNNCAKLIFLSPFWQRWGLKLDLAQSNNISPSRWLDFKSHSMISYHWSQFSGVQELGRSAWKPLSAHSWNWIERKGKERLKFGWGRTVSKPVCLVFFFLIENLLFREVLRSQQSWREGTEISYISPDPTHAKPFSFYQHHSPEGDIYYNWWTYVDTSISPKVHSVH